MSLEYPGSDGVVIQGDTPPGSRPLQRPEPIIKVDRLEYLLWEVADIAGQEAFLQDFGMHTLQADASTLYMRGNGPQQYVSV